MGRSDTDVKRPEQHSNAREKTAAIYNSVASVRIRTVAIRRAIRIHALTHRVQAHTLNRCRHRETHGDHQRPAARTKAGAALIAITETMKTKFKGIAPDREARTNICESTQATATAYKEKVEEEERSEAPDIFVSTEVVDR